MKPAGRDGRGRERERASVSRRRSGGQRIHRRRPTCSSRTGRGPPRPIPGNGGASRWSTLEKNRLRVLAVVAVNSGRGHARTCDQRVGERGLWRPYRSLVEVGVRPKGCRPQRHEHQPCAGLHGGIRQRWPSARDRPGQQVLLPDRDIRRERDPHGHESEGQGPLLFRSSTPPSTTRSSRPPTMVWRSCRPWPRSQSTRPSSPS